MNKNINLDELWEDHKITFRYAPIDELIDKQIVSIERVQISAEYKYKVAYIDGKEMIYDLNKMRLIRLIINKKVEKAIEEQNKEKNKSPLNKLYKFEDVNKKDRFKRNKDKYNRDKKSYSYEEKYTNKYKENEDDRNTYTLKDELLNSDKTVLDEVWDMYKFMDQTEIRSALALFLFRGDDVFKKVSVLSGGERAKISLLKIILSKPNFLILDEPTNHLDINSREVLEEALLNYDGTLLVVSHDRYFINKLSNKIVHLTHDGAVSIDGNYDDYLLFKENNESKKEDVKKESTKVNTYKLQKEQQALERKRNSRISKIEKEIEEKETAIAEIQDLLQLPETSADYQKLLELTEQFDLLKNELDNLYSEWEELKE